MCVCSAVNSIKFYLLTHIWESLIELNETLTLGANYVRVQYLTCPSRGSKFIPTIITSNTLQYATFASALGKHILPFTSTMVSFRTTNFVSILNF